MSPPEDTPPAKDRGTALAEQRTEYAVERTRAAAERTLMAWIRTTLSMIGFGFSIFKFFEYLKESEKFILRRPRAPEHLGLFLVILGVIMLILAMWQHWVFIKRLRERSGQKMPLSLAMIAALFITLVGLFALLNLLFRIGGV